jgi:hypothetical protein
MILLDSLLFVVSVREEESLEKPNRNGEPGWRHRGIQMQLVRSLKLEKYFFSSLGRENGSHATAMSIRFS